MAIPIRIDDQRRPALRPLFVTGLVEHLRVQPTDDLAATARPQRVVLVFGEDQMVRAEACTDERHLFRDRVVHGEMATGPSSRESPRGWMVRPLPTERRILRWTNP